MNERNIIRPQSHAPSGGWPFDDADSDGAGGPVTVFHGVYTEQLPVGELSVREVRERFSDRLGGIDPNAVAVVDGEEVDENTILREGQRLSFTRPSGEKGVA
jgi:hypothetical protein